MGTLYLAADESFGEIARFCSFGVADLRNGNGVGGTPFPVCSFKQPDRMVQ